ncbi:MAG TPA: hypothetical protein VJV75_09785 [Candidatus Polarisedimenticolia bacterium]|nr:hypothetical protein [Candidatus Polarisedimenticolia bacterium]
MHARRRIAPAFAVTALLLFSALPARSGVHLWRVTELFSNADGTIQFIEMTTCCGSAGGEIFVSSQHLRSNSHDFVFPANLTAATLNRHLLLGTAGYSALPGAPTVDYTIPANFFATGGDTISFAVYDTMIFAAGALPTNGTSSLQKDEDDINDIAFVDVNSPTNLHEVTGSVAVVTGPPAVPDGSAGSAPLQVAPLLADGTALRLSFDTQACTANVVNHHIVFGQKSGFPATPGGVYTPLGSVCSVGNVSPYDWLNVPNPPDGLGLIWFIMTTTDATGVEGSGGEDSAGNERRGPGTNGSSGICATAKSVVNTCGNP